MNIVVLGYGRVGREVVAELLRRLPGLSVYVLTTKEGDGALAARAGLRFLKLISNWDMLTPRILPSDIRPFAIVNCLVPFLAIRGMEMALHENAHYIDSSACEPNFGVFEKFPYRFQKIFHQQFCDLDRSAILSAGCDPGLTNAIIRRAASRVGDASLSVHIFDVDVASTFTGAVGMNQDVKVADCSQSALGYLDGKYFDQIDPKFIGLDVETPIVPTLRMMYHEELASIPLVFKNIKAMSFWGTDCEKNLPVSIPAGNRISIPLHSVDGMRPLFLHVGVLIEIWAKSRIAAKWYEYVEVRGGERSRATPENAVAISAAVPMVSVVEAMLRRYNDIPPGVWLPEEIEVPEIFVDCRSSGLSFGSTKNLHYIFEDGITTFVDYLR